ncbi:hypothetical protein CP97_14769 [Aurantiacibacter atlanticus]|uniref:Uncharacterized protein n=1 Tax=Aurantiacibacter atlanticus TaxID=1648404 RepID=A0A168M251_9SPHN|nr:hypothetical protein CP97_14769 [Aurantiacibacter atlanticus]
MNSKGPPLEKKRPFEFSRISMIALNAKPAPALPMQVQHRKHGFQRAKT